MFTTCFFMLFVGDINQAPPPLVFFAPWLFKHSSSPPTTRPRYVSLPNNTRPSCLQPIIGQEIGGAEINSRESDGRSWVLPRNRFFNAASSGVQPSPLKKQNKRENHKKPVRFIVPTFCSSCLVRRPRSLCLVLTTRECTTVTASEVERDMAWTKADRRESRSRSGSVSSSGSSELGPTAPASHINTGESGLPVARCYFRLCGSYSKKWWSIKLRVITLKTQMEQLNAEK